MSEDLPHESGIKTQATTTFRRDCISEDLPHASGIKTHSRPTVCLLYSVGRLAPLIGVSIFSDDLKPGASENVGRILESDKYSDVST